MILLPSLQVRLSHFSRVRLCATPQTAAHQAPPSLGFSRQEHCSGLPFPSPSLTSETEPNIRFQQEFCLLAAHGVTHSEVVLPKLTADEPGELKPDIL